MTDKLNKSILLERQACASAAVDYRRFGASGYWCMSAQIKVFKAITRAASIGFVGAHNAAWARATIEEAFDELYELRASANVAEAHTSRVLYNFLISSFGSFGFKDRREDLGPLESLLELKLDEQIREGFAAHLLSDYAGYTDEELGSLLILMESTYIADFTEAELTHLLEHGNFFSSDFDLRNYHALCLAVHAVERVQQSYASLAADVQVALGGQEGLHRRLQELVSSLSKEDQVYEYAIGVLKDELENRELRRTAHASLVEEAARLRKELEK